MQRQAERRLYLCELSQREQGELLWVGAQQLAQLLVGLPSGGEEPLCALPFPPLPLLPEHSLGRRPAAPVQRPAPGQHLPFSLSQSRQRLNAHEVPRVERFAGCRHFGPAVLGWLRRRSSPELCVKRHRCLSSAEFGHTRRRHCRSTAVCAPYAITKFTRPAMTTNPCGTNLEANLLYNILHPSAAADEPQPFFHSNEPFPAREPHTHPVSQGTAVHRAEHLPPQSTNPFSPMAAASRPARPLLRAAPSPHWHSCPGGGGSPIPGGVPEPWGCGTEGSGPVGWAGVGFGTHAAQPLPAPRATVMLVLVSKALSSSGSEGSPGARW